MSKQNKRKLPEEVRLQGLNNNNRLWFLDFGPWLQTRISRRGINYSQESISQMKNVVLNHLSKFGETDANKLPIESFEPFFNEDRRLTTRNNKVNHIIAFYTFLAEEKKCNLLFQLKNLIAISAEKKNLRKT